MQDEVREFGANSAFCGDSRSWAGRARNFGPIATRDRMSEGRVTRAAFTGSQEIAA